MRLADLDPGWLTDAGRVIGVQFLCPCCRKRRLVAPFANPPDGGPPRTVHTNNWERTGDTFDTLTLSPSVNAETIYPGEKHWHGNITAGEAR